MRFHLEQPPSKKDGKCSFAVRGRDNNGKQFRFFLTSVFKSARALPKQWKQKEQKLTGDPVLAETLKTIKTRLTNQVLTKVAIGDLNYTIENAWNDLYNQSKIDIGGPVKVTMPEKVVEATERFKQAKKDKYTDSYLRIYDQLIADIKLWNPLVTFAHLSDNTLSQFENFLFGRLAYKEKGKDKFRNALSSSAVYSRFKMLKVISKFAQQHDIKPNPAIFDYKVKYKHTKGGFALTWDEILTLWYYSPKDKTQIIVKDYFLLECFTGIRISDLSKLKNGDIHEDFIKHPVTKKGGHENYVTLHKFNIPLLNKYRGKDANSLLLPPISHQAINRIIKAVAKDAGLNRSIRRDESFEPLHKIISSHSGRHSYGTLLSKLGVPPDYIKDELGHSQGNITFGTYVHRDDRFKVIRELVNTLTLEHKLVSQKIKIA